ncbi:ABC transporter ATP-binding protein [Acuticoccus kandeliae]|uniref:ABC transporter ATP-binding protein n=1 Tax=Acuticoccus kandeliae TaxID=2073160 RepID=UPI000D3E3A1D|nr:ABC transporter ATP-binding protein [Acuticoccus kandeliae]
MTTQTRHGAAVDVRGAAKTFPDGTKALQPTDLHIETGETLVLLGPSGCGKTTLLRLIAGLETPDTGGAILFDGEDVTPKPIEARGVGMVFQSYALFPNMNVIENVAYGLRVRGVAKVERLKEAQAHLDLCRIGDLAGRAITDLSGGQRQRVALARALVVKPRILLLDEPLTALDANLREALRAEINDLLRALAITSVYVTHDQAEAMMLGDRIAVLDKGRIAQIGTPREIYGRPATPFVAAFLGVANQIAGHVTDGVFHCEFGAVKVPLADGPATIHFRPDEAEIAPTGEGGLHLDVASVTFLGASQLLAVGTEARPLRLVVPAHHNLEAGDRVSIHLRPETIKTF